MKHARPLGNETPRSRFGQPTKCPDCDGHGYVDHIDLVDRVMYEHCVDCGRKWSMTEDDPRLLYR